MAAATILYVGNDLCHRIPVMETRGIHVVRSECSVSKVRSSLETRDDFSAVTFHNDLFPPADSVISAVREICRVPLVLFRNPTIDCNERSFDLVIQVSTPPEVWSKRLSDAIQEARWLRDYSQQLHKDCASARDWSRRLREEAARARSNLFDYDALFRGDGDGTIKDDE